MAGSSLWIVLVLFSSFDPFVEVVVWEGFDFEASEELELEPGMKTSKYGVILDWFKAPASVSVLLLYVSVLFRASEISELESVEFRFPCKSVD